MSEQSSAVTRGAAKKKPPVLAIHPFHRSARGIFGHAAQYRLCCGRHTRFWSGQAAVARPRNCTMSRHVFYSLHYEADRSRAQLLRSLPGLSANLEAKPSEWATIQRTGEFAFKRW